VATAPSTAALPRKEIFLLKLAANDRYLCLKNNWPGGLFCACVVASLVSNAAGQAVTTPQVIRSITIVRQDVFPVINRSPAFLYRLANRLHIMTRETVIRSDLLFAEGDVFDPELLAESERRLRRLAYLGEARILAEKSSGDSVDVKVVTHDQWSTLISTILNRGGGRTTVGGALEEFNFLGYGKQGFVEGRHEPEGTTWTFRFTDPQLLSSRWTTQQLFVSGPFTNSFSSQLVRPFYSLDTNWSWGGSLSLSENIIREFESGLETNRFERQSNSFSVFIDRAFGLRFKKTRVRLGYQFLDRDFSLTPGLTSQLPQDELIHRTSLRIRHENLSFVKQKQLDKFIRTEDLTLGNISSFTIRRTALPILKGVKRFELLASHRALMQFSTRHYFFILLAFQTLFERDTITSLRLRYYDKSLPRQTLAFNFEFDYDKDPEIERPFILGGDTGLRGYPAREFSGNKRLLLNMEDRLFSPVNILTVQLGGVAFLDAGNIWQISEDVNLADLNYSIGFGLRLGYTRSPNSRVGRIDFAWPLNRGGGFGVSVGVGQQFSLN